MVKGRKIDSTKVYVVRKISITKFYEWINAEDYYKSERVEDQWSVLFDLFNEE